MRRMMWCGYVNNFLKKYLRIQLFHSNMTLSTSSVDTYLLIISQISSLSTILNFGAKLISLYLFPAKNGGKVINKPQIYVFYPRFRLLIKENLRIISRLSTGFTHSYQQSYWTVFYSFIFSAMISAIFFAPLKLG